MDSFNILLIDDYVLVRRALMFRFKGNERFNIVEETASLEVAITKIREKEIDVVVMDIGLKDADGAVIVSEILKQYPHVRIVILTMIDNANKIMEVMEAGALGYVHKNDLDVELERAIEEASRGRKYFGEKYRHKQWEVNYLSRRKSMGAALLADDTRLSKREKEVLQLIFEQCSNKEIAQKLEISLRTVDTHKRNMLEKTGAKSIVGLLIYALDQKVVKVNEMALV